VARIDATIATGNYERLSELMKKIRAMRQSGLEQQGEFGADNLAFKMLRNNGYIKRLVDARNAARDVELSLAELAQPQQRVQYGFMSESPDGVDPTTKMFLEEPVDESPDGVNPTTKMFLDESDIDSVLPRFFDNCIDFLGIQNAPEMVLHHNTDWSESTGSFGQFDPEANVLHLATSGRHVLDILRTMAHELTHCRQNEKHTLPPDAGETGSRWEDQANAMAGRIMRHWAEEHPEMFKDVSLEESASGYIPKNKKEARDPRYAMALSVDIKPGQVGKEANKLALNTGRNGEPGLLMKSANLRESRMPQPSQGPGKYRELNEPLGPESPPKMPAGTIKVDVSDMYDWYKLGQNISNLKSIDKSQLGSGPPSTVFAFGSEDLENMYSHELTKLGLKTHDLDEPGEEDIDEELIAESIDDMLFEINMSPSSLRREAAKTGALAGMEFEMIVPNVGGSGDEDLEPDYDYDQRCRSIEDAYDFFYDGDWNSRRSCDSMRESMQNDFGEWLGEKVNEEWQSQGEEYIYQWVSDNVDESEWNPEDKSDLERTEALEEYAANVHADPVSDQYQTAYEEFREENQENWDESDWLDDAELSSMSEIADTYSMDWPHWSSPQGGEAEISDVAQEFENAIGRDTWASDSYHSGGTLRPSVANQRYIVEPDGSLDPDDSNDRGLEFVSPPLPIDEILSDLNKVKAWAKEYGCYTNDSTGLHINISVPDYSTEKLDFVKLALLMGDKYVLDAFGRSSNTYAKSALDIVKRHVRDNPEEAARLLDKMKSNLDQLATKAIHSGITSKYTSINTKEGHIEFRSPGGDWLDDNFDKIENTLLRFTVAMSAALNPDAYRQEYLTKLYKLLSENDKGNTDTIKYFSEYVAGKIPQAALRSFVKQAQLQRQVKRGKTAGQKMWWRVYKDGKNSGRYGAQIELVATSEDEAKQMAAKEWREPLSVNTLARMDAEPLRPFKETEPTGPMLGNRPSNPDGNYVIVNMADETKPLYRYMAASAEDTLSVLRQWIAANPGQILYHYKFDPDQRLGQPGAPQTSTGTYELFDRRTGEAIPDTEFSARNQAELNTRLDDYINFGPHGIGTVDARLVFGVRPVADSGDAENNAIPEIPLDIEQNFPQRGYQIYRTDTLDAIAEFMAADDAAARERLARYRAEHPGRDYNLRRVSGPPVDVAPAQPAPAGNSFSGQWRVMIDGEEVWRFRGVGNNQADANRIAQTWILDQIRNRQLSPVDGADVEVLPVMI
jgi:hypothetical protein